MMPRDGRRREDRRLRDVLRQRPLSLQIALAVPLLAALAGLFNAFRMTRLPEPEPSGSVEGVAFG
jgi:hypothetical protein